MRGSVPTAAALTCGLALYFTDSVLDQIILDGNPMRVALVPGWAVLAAFVGVAALALVWLGRRSRPRTVTSAPMRLRVGTLIAPLFALTLVVVPYLPFVPDWVPVLQILAGPLKWIVWLTTAGVLGWTLWQARVIRVDWLARATVGQATVLIGVLTALAAGAAASRLAGTVIAPGGDEPHYLVIAQSLWRDGDLKIENNHVRGDYREYFPRELKPDYLTRGVDGEIYSIHPVGLPVLMAPIYGLAGYWGVVLALIGCAACAAALMWQWVVARTNAAGPATFGWAAIALTAPFLYNTFTVYPEIVAGLAVVVAFTLATTAQSGTLWRWLIVGVACGALPWLSTKYAPMSAALVTIALARLFASASARGESRTSSGETSPKRPAVESREGGPSTPSAPSALPAPSALQAPLASASALLAPYVASLIAWFSFFYAYWGTPLPAAPYGDLVQTRVSNLVFGAPGLLFDQEYGVLAYAPVYILAATGLVAMWRAGSERRRLAVETSLAFLALTATVGAFRIWWGGTASPGRPLASGLLLLALPISVAAAAAPLGSAQRAAHHVLLWISVGIAATVMLAEEGLLINNGRDGTSSLLEYWAPSGEVWSVAPTFIFHEAPTAWLHSLMWLLVATAAAIIISRWRTRTAGGAALAALTTLIAALLVITFVMPLLPHDPPLPVSSLAARSRRVLLDKFDIVSRPIAIRYDPFRVDAAASILSLASLTVEPGTRRDPQPIRVLHNGRFSLPAGRYHAEVEWASALSRSVPMSLQIGRDEPAWQTWQVQPQAGARWDVNFDLPVDASFVGFRGGTDLERAMGGLTIKPVSVVDESARPHVPNVLTIWQYGSVAALFHDRNSSPEATGLWVLGGRTSRVTISRATDATPLTLRIHTGLEPNRVTISMRGWQETLTLDAAAPTEFTLPDSNRRLLTIAVHAEAGFYPRTYEPKSEDTRYLGAWVEVKEE